MTNEAVCDRCNGNVKKNDGFLFYASKSFGLPGMAQAPGNMLLCQTCTDQIINDENLSAKPFVPDEISATDVLGDPALLVEAANKVQDSSIIKLCSKHGFTPQQAKEKAHSLALIWWKDKQKAQIESVSFWKSEKKVSDGGSFYQWGTVPEVVNKEGCANCGKKGKVHDALLYIGTIESHQPLFDPLNLQKSGTITYRITNSNNYAICNRCTNKYRIFFMLFSYIVPIVLLLTLRFSREYGYYVFNKISLVLFVILIAIHFIWRLFTSTDIYLMSFIYPFCSNNFIRTTIAKSLAKTDYGHKKHFFSTSEYKEIMNRSSRIN